MLAFLNDILIALEQKEIPVGLFLNLTKAFDIIDHKILLSKLENYSIRGIALNWNKSYVSKIKQIVEVH